MAGDACFACFAYKQATRELGLRKIQDLVISVAWEWSAVMCVGSACVGATVAISAAQSYVTVQVCFSSLGVQPSQAGVDTKQSKLVCNVGAPIYWRMQKIPLGLTTLTTQLEMLWANLPLKQLTFVGISKRELRCTHPLYAPHTANSGACSPYPHTVKTTGEGPPSALMTHHRVH